MRRERTRRTTLAGVLLLLSCTCGLVTSHSWGLGSDAAHRPALGVNNGAGGAVGSKSEDGVPGRPRNLLQQNTVQIIKGPEPESSLRDDDIEISFEVSGFSLGMECQLMRDNTILRFWHQCSSPYYPKGVLTRDGRYTFMVEADSGGDGDNGKARLSWIIDRVSPETKFVGELPQDNSTESIARFNFEAIDHLSGIEKSECQLDTKGWKECQSGVTFQGLSPGRHVVHIRSTDKAGNVQSPVTTHVWTLVAPHNNQVPVPEHLNGNSGNAHLGDPAHDIPPNGEVEGGDHDSSGFWDSFGNIAEDGVDWRSRNTIVGIVVLIVVVALLVLCCGMAIQKCRSRRNRRRQENLMILEQELSRAHGISVSVINPLSDLVRGSESSIVLQDAMPPGLRRFTYGELLTATGGFPESGILGEGGFGKVYKGYLQDGSSVAVKRLESGGQQGDREFFVEVSTLSYFDHPNIVRCLGACVENGNRCCVFALMNKGNARDLLDLKDKSFTWRARLKALLGAARGLAHLHESINPAVVHRDFKTANILLDESGEARISDFGLSTRGPRDPPPRTRRSLRSSSGGEVLPTFGYIAPEYATSGNVTTKSDVYSLGVVMLEFLTGRYPVDTSRRESERNLVKFLLKRLERLDEIKKAVDPVIKGQVSEVQLVEYMEKAAACLQRSQSQRPTAAEVAVTLEQLLALQMPTKMEGALNRKQILLMVDSKSSPALIQAGLDTLDPEEEHLRIEQHAKLEMLNTDEGEESSSEAGPSQRRLFRGPRSGPEGEMDENTEERTTSEEETGNRNLKIFDNR